MTPNTPLLPRDRVFLLPEGVSLGQLRLPPTWQPEPGPSHTRWTMREPPGKVAYFEDKGTMARFFLLPEQQDAHAQAHHALRQQVEPVPLEAALTRAADPLIPHHERVEALLATFIFMQIERHDPAYLKLLESLVEEDHEALTWAAVAILGRLPWPQAKAPLERAQRSMDPVTRALAERLA